MANEIQLTFEEQPAIGFPGMAFTADPRTSIKSGLNSSRKLISVAITASNSQVYTITINGVAYTYTADGSAATTEIAAGLVAAINVPTNTVVLAAGTDTPITLESKIDADFTVSYSAGTGALTPTTVVPAAGALPVAVCVCQDERHPDKQAVRLPRQASDVTSGRAIGAVLSDVAKISGVQFNPYTMVPVLESGRCFVTVEEDVKKGDDVFVRYASGSGGSQLGAFRKSDDTSTAAQLPRAIYDTDGSAGGLAVLKLNR